MRLHLIIIMAPNREAAHLLIRRPQVMGMIRIHLLLSDVVPGNFLIPAQKVVTQNKQQKVGLVTRESVSE
ncbi:hypothetical protein BJI49_05890 [Acetobacter pasteurianus]|uniref:Uncharacterized protein n=1 Tax=Acetobacter pasteurianus TaxID=438 RepID=A0A1A0CDW8_ACEPA|nr:hypothetical protein SRCM100623_02776 [Acetobacter pasteurianus]RCL07489.1 hypothetical protein BJI49_05890 [Acetobacter pasteurianus]